MTKVKTKLQFLKALPFAFRLKNDQYMMTSIPHSQYLQNKIWEF